MVVAFFRISSLLRSKTPFKPYEATVTYSSLLGRTIRVSLGLSYQAIGVPNDNIERKVYKISIVYELTDKRVEFLLNKT